MSFSDKNKTAISLVIFLLILFLLVGIGIYKFQHNGNLSDNETVSPAQEEVLEKNSTAKKANPDSPVAPEIPMLHPDSGQNEERGETIEHNEAIEKEAESAPLEKKELTAIYIPITKSLFSSSSVSFDSFKSRMTHGEPAQGKIYYQGDNGKIESLLSIDSNGSFHEQLVSYDPEGNPVDRIEIGLLCPETNDKKYATLSVNRLSVFELSTAKTGKKEERVTEYSITPQLRFVRGKTFTKLL
jgi:hypothetical protein